jgi:glycerophosphoryl diester phosphodiesterase
MSAEASSEQPGAPGVPRGRSGEFARLTRAQPLRVGHKGAAHIAPGNTPESFAAAIAAGVDMIEFDVLSEHPDGSGRLLLAHDYDDLRTRPALTLTEGLEHLAGATYAGIELDVDVKQPGYGARVVRELRARDLIGRSLVSSMFPRDLDAMRAVEPSLRVGWSVPRVKRDYTRHALTALPALALLGAFRLRLPARARRALRLRRVNTIMAHWRVVSRALVAAVHDAGGELFVWTVDDPAMVRRLSDWGVDGIISNDPRIFDPAFDVQTLVRAAARAARGDGDGPDAQSSLADPVS